MEDKKKEMSIQADNGGKIVHSFFFRSSDFRLFILGMVFFIVFRYIFRLVILFAENTGYSSGGFWRILASMIYYVRGGDVFLGMDYGILASTIILLLSIISARDKHTVGKLICILLSGMIIFILASGYFFDLTLDPSNILIFITSVAIFVSLSAIVACIKLSIEKQDMIASTDKIQTTKGLLAYCFQSEDFRLLFCLTAWLLLFGTILSKVLLMLDEILVVFLPCLAASILFSLLLIVGVLLTSRKVKKAFNSLIAFVAIMFLFVPFYMVFIVFLLYLRID